MRPSRLGPDTSLTSAMSPTLTLATLRSDTSTTASIGSSPTIWAISLPAKANAEVPTSEISVMTPSHGAVMMPRSRSASAVASAASAALYCASSVFELQPRNGVGRDQPPLGLELDRALLEQRLGLQHLGLAGIVRQDGDDVALLHDASRGEPATPEARRWCARTSRPCGRPRCGRRATACGCARRRLVSITATRNRFSGFASLDPERGFAFRGLMRE